MRFVTRHIPLIILAIVLSLSCCTTEQSQKKEKSPKDLFPGLFEAVQTRHIFVDSKTFTDCIPKGDPDDILNDYEEQHKRADFDLRAFINEHFELPEVAGTEYKSTILKGTSAHIEELWKVLSRKADAAKSYSSLLELPYPYIVPGGRFREIYYWDSYFTMLGLLESGRNDMAKNMLNNFAYLIRTYGFIPNGNRTYYLTRSQPPYFSQMVRLIMESEPNHADSILKANLDALQKEYYFWMKGKKVKAGASEHVVYFNDGLVLNRYYDSGNWPREEAYLEDIETAKAASDKSALYRELRSGAESGWDYSSRWFDDGRNLSTIRTTSIVPVDLNCLLYDLEQLLAMAYEKANDKAAAAKMYKTAAQRKLAIMKYCWNPATSWFEDLDFEQAHTTGRLTLAGVYPMYFKMISRPRADSMAIIIKDKFLKPGGLVTSLTDTGQQWDSPNGWAPLQWMSYVALSNYRQSQLASEVAGRWIGQNDRIFKQTGKMTEKYNVIDTALKGGGGEYPNQDGFGWTNGVYLKMKRAEMLKNASAAK